MVKIRRASRYFARLMRPRKLKKNDHQSIRPSRAPSMAKLATSARALKANTEADYRDTSRFLRWTSVRAGGGGRRTDVFKRQASPATIRRPQAGMRGVIASRADVPV